MYKVGIIGHRAGTYHVEAEILQSRIKGVLEVLKYQYGNDLMINIGGGSSEADTNALVGKTCRELGIKYSMFLISPISNDDVSILLNNYRNASGVTIRSSEYIKEYDIEVSERLIDDSNFIICFWEGKKTGRTFDLIKYALKKSRIVLNGFDELKLLTNIDLKRRRK